jgi:hypothetical protein
LNFEILLEIWRKFVLIKSERSPCLKLQEGEE